MNTKTLALIGGPLDGTTAESKDGEPPAPPGAVVHLPSGDVDGLLWAYGVRASDPSRADYLGAGYFGLPNRI